MSCLGVGRAGVDGEVGERGDYGELKNIHTCYLRPGFKNYSNYDKGYFTNTDWSSF